MAARPGSRLERWSSPGRGGRVDGPIGDAGGLRHGVVEPVDRGLDPGADVDDQPAAALGRPGEGVDDVVDVDEVAGLGPVAEDRAGLAGQQPAGPDGDHAGFAVGVLPRPEHVGQGQGGVLEAVQLPVGVEVVAHHLLGHAVGRDRSLRMGLLDRELGRVRVAVDRAPAGGEHHLAGARGPGPLEHLQAADHVDLGVVDGPGHRDPDIGLGGEVEDHLRPAAGHQVDDVGGCGCRAGGR